MNSDVLQERLTRGLVLAFIFLALLLVVCSSPAQADDRRDRREARYSHDGHRGSRDYDRDDHRRHGRHDYRQDRGDHRRYARHGDRHDRGRGHGHAYGHQRSVRHVSTHHARYRYSRARPFVVPGRIVTSYVGAYRPYYAGRAYFPGHRHHHVVYRFPVYTGFGLVWRPHAYCGERLFVSGDLAFRRGHVSIRLNF